MGVITIIYDEGSKAKEMGYKRVELHYGKNDLEIWKSGYFVKDWYDAVKFIITNIFDEPVVGSSSIGHFISDGAPYDSAYLYFENGEAILKYEYNHDDPGIELFVPRGTKPTWKTLKKTMM